MERRSEVCLGSVEKSELNAAQAACYADGCAVVLIGCKASEMFLRPLPYSSFLLLLCSGLCHSIPFNFPDVFPLFVCHWISSGILSSPLSSCGRIYDGQDGAEKLCGGACSQVSCPCTSNLCPISLRLPVPTTQE